MSASAQQITEAHRMAPTVMQEYVDDIVRLRRANERLRQIEAAARALMALMDDVALDDNCPGQTDRVFALFEFDDLRRALDIGGPEHTTGYCPRCDSECFVSWGRTRCCDVEALPLDKRPL